ncbi:TIGR04255 family protein [Burkholderia sp. BCC1630]|uniref:TIGR04255 family protein n=1 Tax=Burkholderia sp. BCC1630 TaxID=2676304 RepID=UPI00158CB2F4|nr:TIGR04255 family protein [Burkholderia sp. BCC1630]
MGIIYQNPSLVEVICEVHWELTSLVMPPGAAVDPFFDVIRADLTPRMLAAGFANVQELVPPQVPKQLLAWQPTLRFAPSAEVWPKAQLGPGIFTVNMSGQSYTGWPDFEPTVASAIGALLQSFPNPERFLKIKSLQLKYLNSFTAKHNFRNYAQFSSEFLGLKSVLPNGFADKLGATATEISTTSQTKLPIPNPNGSHLLIQVAEGQANQVPGCIVQLSVEKSGNTATNEIADWFHAANLAARMAFQSLVTPQLSELLRPEEKK